MALTAFPEVHFNSSTGSDTSPTSAAATGTATAVASTTVALTVGAGSLSGVPQDGSAYLQVDGVGFVRIDTHNGTDSVVVETAITCTDANFSICYSTNGIRATIAHTESARLFAATSSPIAVGASGRWTLVIGNDGALSLSAAITMAFTAGGGYLTIRSSVAGTRRTSTQSGNAYHFTCNAANRILFRDIVFRNSNATKNYVVDGSSTAYVRLENCIVGDAGGTNCPLGFINRTGGGPTADLWNSAILSGGGSGINGTVTVIGHGSIIALCTSNGIANSGAEINLTRCIIAHNGADGINTAASAIRINSCTIADNTGDGIQCTANTVTGTFQLVNSQITANTVTGTFQLVNSQITGNNAFGLNFSGTAPHFPTIEFCNFHDNTSGNATGVTLSSTNLTLDPQYTDASSSVRNYDVGANSRAVGFPASSATIGAGQSGTTNYLDIGAAQHEDAGAGSSRSGFMETSFVR